MHSVVTDTRDHPFSPEQTAIPTEPEKGEDGLHLVLAERPEEPPSKVWWMVTRIVLPLIILIVGIAGTAGLILAKKPPARDATADPKPLVETIRLDEAPASIQIDQNGVVVPRSEITLASEVRGRIVYKNPRCLNGEFLKAGSVLFKIDDLPYQLQIQQLESEIARADATLVNLDVESQNTHELIKLAETSLSLVEGKLRRALNLGGGGSVTQDEIDNLKSELVNSRNSLQKLKNDKALLASRKDQTSADKRLSQAKLKVAEYDLSRCTITMPVDGIISGQTVEEGDAIQDGKTLCQVLDTSVMEVRCELRMEDLAWLWRDRSPGETPEELGLASHDVPEVAAIIRYRLGSQEFSWKGKLVRLEGGSLLEQNRSIPCRIEITEPIGRTAQSQLRTPVKNMFVDVSLILGRPQAVVRVPVEAVRPGNKVWRVRDGKLDVLTVHIARQLPDAVLIDIEEGDDGLRPDDEIVVSPLLGAHTGLEVRTQPDNETKQEVD